MNTTTTISAENCILVSCLAIGWAVLTITKDLLIPLACLALALARWRPARPPAATLVSPARVEPSGSLVTLEDVLNATPVRVQQRLEALLLRKAGRLPADKPFHGRKA